jgi:hypothetical protein
VIVSDRPRAGVMLRPPLNHHHPVTHPPQQDRSQRTNRPATDDNDIGIEPSLIGHLSSLDSHIAGYSLRIRSAFWYAILARSVSLSSVCSNPSTASAVDS